jgi:hypothetical protein
VIVAVDEHVEALREFFVRENDDRLGRCRWLTDSDYVIYDLGGGLLRIMRESDAVTWQIGREENAGLNLNTGDVHSVHYAARAYFDAHPEPKPWHDAKPGEVWVLETRSDLGVDKRAWHITDRPESFWALTQGYLLVKSNAIVSGRRIWPEVQS